MSAMSGSPPMNPLVLLVDDDEDSRFLYGHVLTTSYGYRIAEASNGRQGVDMASELKPDVIVMDLTLPLVDGWQAMRELRRDHRTCAIPIVALTGHAQVQSNKATEFQAVLLKPCLPDALASQLEALLASPGVGSGQDGATIVK